MEREGERIHLMKSFLLLCLAKTKTGKAIKLSLRFAVIS